MRRFIQGYIGIERMIEELRFHKPAIHYFFGTEKAMKESLINRLSQGELLELWALTQGGLSGNLVGISINLCKSIQKELFINDTP